MVSQPSSDSSDESVRNEYIKEAIEEANEDEMLDYAHEFNNSSSALREYVNGLRKAKKNLTNEVRGLRNGLGYEQYRFESLEHEIIRLNERNKEVESHKLNAFVSGFVIGVLLVIYVMYY